ncbi:hypothetical protein [Nocardia paucivorans]|uniref:hypothetical protein n=1 Tax=Nocardia paucivorans TaxID=114259 RepID=UPI0002E76D57|nr:hypothetical protein [Nocardia paucivorans]
MKPITRRVGRTNPLDHLAFLGLLDGVAMAVPFVVQCVRRLDADVIVTLATGAAAMVVAHLYSRYRRPPAR